MGDPRPFAVLGFRSVHDALEAETVLKRAGVFSIAIPSPRELGELCGIALRIERDDAERAQYELGRAGRPPLATAEIIDR